MLDDRHLAVGAGAQHRAGEGGGALAVEPVQDQDGVLHGHARGHRHDGGAPEEGGVQLGEGVDAGVGGVEDALGVGQLEGVADDDAAGGEGGVELAVHDLAVVDDEQGGPRPGHVEHLPEGARKARRADAVPRAVRGGSLRGGAVHGRVGVEVDPRHPAVAPDLLGLGRQVGGGEAFRGGRPAGPQPGGAFQGDGGVSREAAQGSSIVRLKAGGSFSSVRGGCREEFGWWRGACRVARAFDRC